MSNLSVNAIRFLGIDAIEKSKSGHPGIVMGAAPMAYSPNGLQPQWLTASLPRSSALIHPNRIGLTVIVSSYQPAMAPCFFMASFICQDLKMSQWTRSRTSVNGGQKHQVTQNLVIQQV